jgi:hypothetical protein
MRRVNVISASDITFSCGVDSIHAHMTARKEDPVTHVGVRTAFL